MPFYQLKGGHYVFLHSKNSSELNDIALKDKSDDWRFSSHIQGREECKEAEKLRHKAINKIYKESLLEDFFKEWVYFNLKEHSGIIEDLPFLLYDYGCINKLFSHRRIQEETMETIFPDLYYDKDCTYEIALFSKSGMFKKLEKVFSTIIDTREIVSVKGELDDFSIKMKDKTLHFGKTITVK